MMPKTPMQDDEIKMHKPACADFVSFRAGIRCAERVYDVAALAALRAQPDHSELIEKLRDAAKYEYHPSYDALFALAADALEVKS